MGRFRRRKTKYTWLPQLGFQASTAEMDSVILPVSINAAALNGDPSDPNIFAIIPDAPKETAASAFDEHLSDYVGSEYTLRRIVGNIFFSAPHYVNTTNPQATQVAICAGFFVARVDAGDPSAIVPIGATSAALRRQNYGPVHVQTTREPWIWRRTWMMSPLTMTAAGAQNYLISAGDGFAGTYPLNNYLGSVAEGSKVDAKTIRRIRGDERLFFSVQAVVLEAKGTIGSATVSFPNGSMDLRFLGALRRARGKGAF